MGFSTLRYTSDAASARQEVEQAGGRVLQDINGSVLVVELPAEDDADKLRLSSQAPEAPLDETTQLAVDAWRDLQNRPPQAPDQAEGLSWDAPGYTPPVNNFDMNKRMASRPPGLEEAAQGTPTSLYMLGTIAVGLILVSRHRGAEQLSQAERKKIIQEVQLGLDWLARVEPRARISFSLDIQVVTVEAEPGPQQGIDDPYEAMEAPWRDEALRTLGYPAGRSGYGRYVADLQKRKGTDWAFVAFFTRYKLHHFAYAIWEKVVMHYENDSWGVNSIHQVFAHEACHVFGAADEYGNCSCGGEHGYLKVPNNNCVQCFRTGTQESCLMSRNVLRMCEWSRKQIGWDPSLFNPA